MVIQRCEHVDIHSIFEMGGVLRVWDFCGVWVFRKHCRTRVLRRTATGVNDRDMVVPDPLHAP